MFLNILKVRGSNVLETFVNLIFSIARTFAIFHSHKPATGSINGT